jgi:putative FmdB family regulatory protein
MPTYEYACSSCKNAWELEQSIKDDAITECPACHQATAKRQISRGGGFILKGGGWYADAYSSSSNAKPAAASTDTPAATGTDGSAAAKPSGGTSEGASSAGASSAGASSGASSGGSSSSEGSSGSSTKSTPAPAT